MGKRGAMVSCIRVSAEVAQSITVNAERSWSAYEQVQQLSIAAANFCRSDIGCQSRRERDACPGGTHACAAMPVDSSEAWWFRRSGRESGRPRWAGPGGGY